MLNLGNALMREDGWPPDHLLRLAFETCESFEDANSAPLAGAAGSTGLFTLTGTRPDEMAVVERTEREALVLRGHATVANDWQMPRQGWNGRMGLENNEARKAAMRVSPPAARRSVGPCRPC